LEDVTSRICIAYDDDDGDDNDFCIYCIEHIVVYNKLSVSRYLEILFCNFVKVKQSHHIQWRRRVGSRYSSYSFINSALDGGEWSGPGRSRFTLGEITLGTHRIGGWVDPRAGLHTEATGKILSPVPGIEPLSPGRTARSQTLFINYLR
jgi:hypothetical protein